MNPYAIAGIGATALIAIAFLVLWLNHTWAKNQGASEVQADNATSGLKVEKKMADAAANAPADVKAVSDEARRGEF